MAALEMAGLYYISPQVELRYLDGSQFVSIEVVKRYLPRFIFTSEFSQTFCVHMEDHVSNRYDREVISMIFEYLIEIQDYGGSAALLDSLEDLWEKTRQQRHRRRHPSNLSYMANVFQSLGRILDPVTSFGCGEAISDLLSTFFINHCDEIMWDEPHQWTSYVRTLCITGAAMTPIYSCLLRHPHRVWRALESGAADFYLSPKVSDELETMLYQKQARPYRKHAVKRKPIKHHGHGGYGSAIHRGGIFRPGIHNGVIHRGGTQRLRNGAELSAEELLYIWDKDPDRICVLEGDEFDDRDPHSIDDSEFHTLGPYNDRPRHLLLEV